MPHLLIVGDDQNALTLLTSFLQKHNYYVSVAKDGDAMFKTLRMRTVDLVILDAMWPKKNGFSVCQRLRTSSKIPVIMLSDQIVGLGMDDDDYLIEPFLLARVKAVLRRAAEPISVTARIPTRPTLKFGTWPLNGARNEFYSADNSVVFLPSSKFDLRVLFVEHPQRVLTGS
ncbi:two component transcriptional regulator [Gluconobacter oxydans]|uniref:response regulator transcription factor n=1 Tax=Gluconobacter thailandicus TaxID=257438 RepID=UPI00036A7B97|nr:response regulator transcription factor [Gluconobacter thailandicus]ANQ41906.1 two component transcriptional regulator [Gluconobacter oxydans]